MFLKVYINLLTALGAETHVAEECWLEEQLDIQNVRCVPNRNMNTARGKF
jgi:hypothetical protein